MPSSDVGEITFADTLFFLVLYGKAIDWMILRQSKNKRVFGNISFRSFGQMNLNKARKHRKMMVTRKERQDSSS